MFVNLFVNVVKYMFEGGVVYLFLIVCEGEVIVLVCDNGVGIDGEFLLYIFDIFV